MNDFPERVPDRTLVAAGRFIYDAPEDGGGLLRIEGEVLGTGLGPYAVAEAVEGPHGGSR